MNAYAHNRTDDHSPTRSGRPYLTLILGGDSPGAASGDRANGPTGDTLLERLRGTALPAGAAMGASTGFVPAP